MRKLQNNSEDLKTIYQSIMKDYATSFNREINGRPITVDDIKYFAKIEHQRTFKGTDKQVRENQPFATKILQLKTDIRKIEQGQLDGNIKKMKSKIANLKPKHHINKMENGLFKGCKKRVIKVIFILS